MIIAQSKLPVKDLTEYDIATALEEICIKEMLTTLFEYSMELIRRKARIPNEKEQAKIAEMEKKDPDHYGVGV